MSVNVTGVGVVSAIGADPASFAAALREGQHGCALHEFKRLDGRVVIAPAYLAATPDPQGLIEPRKLRRMFRLVRMAAVAARQALQMAGRDPAAMNPSRIGIVFGTAFGALEITQKFIDSWVENGEQHASPLNFMNSVHGILASQIALDINATGLNLTISQRDISFEAALAHGVEQLDAGRVDVMLVGGADELTPLLHEIGSRALQVSLDAADAHGLDPLARKPVVVPGDGAGVVVLEREGKAMARLAGASVGRHDHGGPDVSLQLWRAQGKPELGLITNNRDGSARAAKISDAREAAWRRETSALFASHRGAFGTFATAGALQFVANVLMLARRKAFLPVVEAPVRILHDAASSSGVHAAYLLDSAE
jgi:hypothetical protein